MRRRRLDAGGAPRVSFFQHEHEATRRHTPMKDRPDDRKRPESPKPIEVEHARETERAAPPDDGGHQGSFTVPADVTEVGEDMQNEGTPEHPAPDLHWGPRTGAQKRLETDDEG